MTRYTSSPCGSLTHYILYWRRLILRQQAQKWLAAHTKHMQHKETWLNFLVGGRGETV